MICYNPSDQQILQRHLQDITKLSDKLTIGVTSGCFDLLHPLHVLFLEKCKEHCDILTVFVDSDQLITSNKGKYTVLSQRDRAYMLSHLDNVNHVVIMRDYFNDFKSFVEFFLPKKVKVFKNSSVIYDSQAETFGGELIIIPDVFVPRSTTEIREFICSTK